MLAKLNQWGTFLTPLGLSLMVVNAVCFGACLVLLCVSNSPSVPLILLTLGTGVAFGARFAGAWVASKKRIG